MPNLGAYLELTKLRLSSLVLITTAVGFWLGQRPGQSLWPLLEACLATACVVGGANALNQWWEREADARMHRTRTRPLPSGRLQPAQALGFGLALSLLGIGWLAGRAHALAAGLAAVSWVSYVLVYTPLKRRTALSTLVGAVPGALPPVIGWAAARGSVGIEAGALFLIIFVWQLPHFLAIAMVHRDDYARAGFPVLPVLEPEGLVTARQTLLYGLVLVPVSVFPAMLGLVGPWYFVGAGVLSLGFLVSVLVAVWQHSAAGCRQLFRASIAYLPLLFALLVVDHAFWRRVPAAQAAPAMPASLQRVPRFTLTDQAGQPFGTAQLQGRAWIVDFIFTRCAGQCPMMNARMGTLAQRFAGARGLGFLSITVDPDHDTPAVLAAYAQQLHASIAQWRFLTGPEVEVHQLAREGFRLGVAKEGAPAEPITHSVRLVLIDQAGRIRGYYDAMEAAAMAQLTRDVEQLLALKPAA